MMGPRQVEQGALFYEFSLDTHVPVDHLLRAIDRFVDLSGLRAHLRPFYSTTGRPSVDPELMIRMLLVGYCFGIRSERRLCEEVHLNLAYRWFCRLGLEGAVPDHSTFSKNRHGRFRDSDLLREVVRDHRATLHHLEVDDPRQRERFGRSQEVAIPFGRRPPRRGWKAFAMWSSTWRSKHAKSISRVELQHGRQTADGVRNAPRGHHPPGHHPDCRLPSPGGP